MMTVLMTLLKMIVVTQQSHLASQVDACKHDVLGVVVKAAECQVKAFEEQQGCSGDLVWEGESLADLLHFGLIIFA